ncbi:MAG: GAF domain-containing protein [Candidatus Melainabacteria bacterium]|nr:GAF domain-containing protein [Candidatus Melainabacteria bacterium]
MPLESALTSEHKKLDKLSMISLPKAGRLEMGMSRMCVFDILGGFLTLKESLKTEVGDNVKEILYKSGYEAARLFLERLIENKTFSPDETGLQNALLQYSLAGFGNFSIADCDLKNCYVTIVGSDCFEAWAHKEKKLFDNEQVCDYTRGVLAGFIGSIYTFQNPDFVKELFCVETSCSLKSKKNCCFVIGQKSMLVQRNINVPEYAKPPKHELELKATSLEKTLKRLKAIEDISYVCSNLFTADVATTSHKVLKPFCELTGANYGVVLLLKNFDKQICLEATYGFPEHFKDSFNKELMVTINSENIHENWPSVRSMLKKQIVVIKDTTQMSVGFSKLFNDSIKPNKIKSVASVPLVINDKAVGAITKYFSRSHVFDDEELSFMKTTANIITSTIERNHLLEVARKSENKLAEANEVLKQVNQELDSFVYIASHDLREPLRTIESFVSIIQDKLTKDLYPHQQDYLFRIVKATQRMRKLIEDLTHLARATRDTNGKEKEVIDLNAIVTEVQFELTAFIEKKNAEIVLHDKLPKIIGNKEKILSVFKNLIANGIKFNESKKPLLVIRLIDNVGVALSKICICIEDNGIGIEKEYTDKVFGLFQRLHAEEEYEGTGAGLAIVKKILEKYNCEIWFESEKGKGSKFYFTLPKTDLKN